MTGGLLTVMSRNTGAFGPVADPRLPVGRGPFRAGGGAEFVAMLLIIVYVGAVAVHVPVSSS